MQLTRGIAVSLYPPPILHLTSASARRAQADRLADRLDEADPR